MHLFDKLFFQRVNREGMMSFWILPQQENRCPDGELFAPYTPLQNFPKNTTTFLITTMDW